MHETLQELLADNVYTHALFDEERGAERQRGDARQQRPAHDSDREERALHEHRVHHKMDAPGGVGGARRAQSAPGALCAQLHNRHEIRYQDENNGGDAHAGVDCA